MSTPKVSVIIPVYNTEKYLRQCIDSIMKQTLEEIEVVIVDDGSKEECALLCDELAKADPRIKIIHKQNEGQGIARNVGIKASCGEYIGFVDSDDFIKPDMYEVLYNTATKNSADIVVSGICFVGGNTFCKEGDYAEKNYFDEDTVFDNEGMKKLILGVVGALPNEPDDSRYGVSVCKNLFRRTLIEDGNIEFLSERKIMSEDTLFIIDCAKIAKKAVGISGTFYCYRRNDESFSKSYKSDRLEKVMIFLAEVEAHIKETLTKEEYKLYLDRLTQGYGRILCSQEIMYARDNNIKYSTLKNKLIKICTNERIVSSLKQYPWYRLPKKQAAFAFAMKHRLYFLQKLMVSARAR